MAGQASHFINYAPKLVDDPAKIEYGRARYVNELNRLYGVMERRLERSPLSRRRVLDRRHGGMAVDCAARTGLGRTGMISQSLKTGSIASMRAPRCEASVAKRRSGAQQTRRTANAAKSSKSSARVLFGKPRSRSPMRGGAKQNKADAA